MQNEITNTEDINSINLYFKDVSKEKLISKEEELKLFQEYRKTKSEAIKEKILKSNLRFVIKVAKQYQNRGLPLEDLISEGNLGVLKAIDKFDETKGYHFISYAVWWIRQSIIRAIYYTGSNVRLPTSQIEPKIKINKIIYEFEQREGRRPSITEISELSGFTEKHINDVQLSSNECISVNTPTLGDEENCTVGDCISDDINETPDVTADHLVIKNEINKILDTLNNRDHDIMCMLFGLNGCYEMSYEEIARKFALSGERIRQISKGLLNSFRTKYKNNFEKLL